jgi:Ca-activated chloride channel family protein
MGGAPLDQLRRVSSALIDTLGEGDTLELIEFSNEPRRWKQGAVAITAQAKHDAHGWIRKLRASGGTEMRTGILEALAGLRDEAQRQVVLMTDGQIGFEQEVVHAIASRLPPGSRVHTVGIGSSVNRSLTGPAARAGRGVEVVIGYDEDPAEAASTLTRRTEAPLRVDLSLTGSAWLEHAPQALPDLFASSPAQISVRLRPEGGELVLRARGAEGAWEQRITVPACAPGEGALQTAALFARERVEDHETALAGGAPVREIDAAIESLGLAFQIATRRTSWVAIRHEPTVDPRLPTRRARMPHELPAGMSAEGLGLRAASPMAHAFGPMPVQAPAPMAASRMSAAPPSAKPSPQGGRGGAPVGAPGASFKMRETEARKESARAQDAAPPAEPKRKKSLVESVRDFLFSDHDDAAVLADEAAESSLSRTLSGRVLRRDGRVLIVEITVPEGGLAWDPDGVAELLLRDGRVERVMIEVSRSTHAGSYGAGLVLRLVLTLADESPRDLASVRLSRPDGSVLIITL